MNPVTSRARVVARELHDRMVRIEVPQRWVATVSGEKAASLLRPERDPPLDEP